MGIKTAATLSNLEAGQTYYFAATAYDASRMESPLSQELSFQTDLKGLPRNSPSDFNGDNNTDILWQHQGTGEVYVWFMDGSSFIRDQHIQTIKEIEWRIAGVGDFNSDGKPDILWHHQQRGDVYVWFMDEGRFLYDKYIRTVPEIEWQIEAVGDYNGDGKPDILWRNHRTGEVYVWFMDGATFVTDKHIRTIPDANWKIVN